VLVPPADPVLSLIATHPDRGDAAVAATLAVMRRLALDASRDPVVLATARAAAALDRDGGFSRRTLAERITRWLAEHTRYVPDPTTLEVVRPPRRLLDDIRAQGWAAEDCESLATLHAALLEAVGVPTRFRVLARSQTGPYEHVMVEALTEEGWRPYDVATRDVRLGAPLLTPGRTAVWEDRTMLYGLGQDEGYPDYGPLATEPPQTPPEVTTDRIDWSGVGGVIGAIGTSLAKIGATALPFLERYGVLEPKRGPSRLPLPGEPTYGWAAETGYGTTWIRSTVATVPGWVWLGGGALLLVALTRRGRRRA